MVTDEERSRAEPAAIVGIGASAGGLEAFEQFYQDAPGQRSGLCPGIAS
ncbi:MAG: hypothetical protein U5J62_04765 [Desulfurivibrio sp.]|nr:hypothetical protein [Desulfurivibrio sp.]